MLFQRWLALLVGEDMLRDIIESMSYNMNIQALTIHPEQFRQNHQGKTVEKDQKAFLIAVRILEAWAFNDSEKAVVLGDVPIATFRRMKAGKMSNKLTTDRRTRVSLILGIHKALRMMFLQDAHILEWITHSNRAFAEYSPKDIMLSGSLVGLHDIRRYLDALQS